MPSKQLSPQELKEINIEREASLENFAIRSAFQRQDLQLAEENARLGSRMGFNYDYGKDDPVNRLFDPRGHGTDKGKLPWHPTFSDESDYSTPENPGGKWGHDVFGDTFTPAKNQINSAFNQYMQRYEPDVRIIK